ncbi:MAG TPA: HAD family phosphatase [Bryobacteraceae bacterium]|nr:HAD family phosphatase [Bryobacteraceae bacterium]
MTTLSHPWDALLFDFDGVLADTEPLHYACWREILEPYGIQLDWGFYQKECIGVSDRLMIHTLASERVPPIPFEEIWPEYERKQVMFRTRLEAQHPFLPETVDLIRSLSNNYKLAVVSSSGRSEVEPPIERAGFRSCFQTLICGREVPNLKPAPDPYLKAAELLGATRPLVIEDSDAGIASATAAGFDVLRVSSAHTVAAEVRAHLASSTPL